MSKPKAVRKLDELGRIIIPAEVRAIMDWSEKSAVEIWVNDSASEVTLKTHTYACTHCGTTENLKKFHKRHICTDCQSAISKL